MPRIYCSASLMEGDTLDLPAGAARHVQVLRLQPGEHITLFNGGIAGTLPFGGEFDATVTRMGRSDVQVQIGAHTPLEREAGREVHLALGMPANERMDWLVEKATELGVASIQPLATQRSVLKLKGERADKKLAHWQGIAIAACEQCGRNRVPVIHDVAPLVDWVQSVQVATRLLLSLAPDSRPLLPADAASLAGPAVFLSGPEGGLSHEEEAAARACGFLPMSLGPRTLRADTAPLAALAALTLLA
jgi:16S rRNA (uracil1498-N3)-methyltransferase